MWGQIGSTIKNGSHSVTYRRIRQTVSPPLTFTTKYHNIPQTKALLVFLFVYYLGKPIFVNFGVSDRRRFFTALTLSFILETTIFAITGASGYKLISP